MPRHVLDMWAVDTCRNMNAGKGNKKLLGRNSPSVLRIRQVQLASDATCLSPYEKEGDRFHGIRLVDKIELELKLQISL